MMRLATGFAVIAMVVALATPVQATDPEPCTPTNVTAQYQKRDQRLLVEWACDGFADHYVIKLKRNGRTIDKNIEDQPRRWTYFDVSSRRAAQELRVVVKAYFLGQVIKERFVLDNVSNVSYVVANVDSVKTCKRQVHRVSAWDSDAIYPGNLAGNYRITNGRFERNVSGSWVDVHHRVDIRDGKAVVHAADGTEGPHRTPAQLAQAIADGGGSPVKFNGNDNYDPTHSHFRKPTRWCIANNGGLMT